ncbi:MAG: hypothetical protein ACPL5F_12605 [Moorellaceae bacterium]
MSAINGHALPAVNVKKSPGRPPRLDLERLRQLHACGADDAEIAAQMGVERSTIVKARQRLGLPANRPRGRRHSRNGPLVVTKDEIFQQHVQAVRELSAPAHPIYGRDWLKWARTAYTSSERIYICTLPQEEKPGDMPKKIQIPLLVPD